MSDYRVFVPFVNRPDLLHKAVESLDDVKDYLTVIDNSVIDQDTLGKTSTLKLSDRKCRTRSLRR